MSPERLQNSEQFPLVLGLLLLLQPRATTVVTRSHWDPEIPTCRENIRVCVSRVQKNLPFLMTNYAIAISNLHSQGDAVRKYDSDSYPGQFYLEKSKFIGLVSFTVIQRAAPKLMLYSTDMQLK